MNSKAINHNHAPRLVGSYRGKHRVIAAILSFLVSITLVLIAINSWKVDAIILFASLATFSFLIACLVLVAGDNRPSALFNFRLGPMFFTYASVAFGIASITLNDPESRRSILPLAAVPGSLFELCLAFGFAAVGYLLSPISHIIGAPLRVISHKFCRLRSTQTRSVTALYFVFFLGLLADLVNSYLGGRFGYLGDATLATSDSSAWYTQPLLIVSALQLAGIFGLAVITFSRERNMIAILGPALMISIPLGILSGMKEEFVDIGLAVLIPYIWIKGRIPVVATLSFIFAFILIVTPSVTQLRGDVRGEQTLNVGDSLSYGWSQLVSTDGYLSNVDPRDSAMQVLSRLRMTDNYILIKTQTPEIFNYRPISEVMSAPITGFIPRLVWPDKPVRLSGYEFYKSYWQGEGQSSSAVTPQGSLYMYGGLLLLLIGMFAIGLTLRAIDDGIEATKNIHSALFLVFLIPPIVKQESDVPGFLASIAILGLTWVVVTFCVFKPKSIDT